VWEPISISGVAESIDAKLLNKWLTEARVFLEDLEKGRDAWEQGMYFYNRDCPLFPVKFCIFALYTELVPKVKQIIADLEAKIANKEGE
jgi:hypothetical protein